MSDATQVGASRRSVLQAAGLLALAGVGGCAAGRGGTARAAKPARSLRVAHMTDVHIEPERRAPEGFAKALAHVHGQADRPDMILTGGDLVMDSFECTDARAKTQWDVFTRVLRENTKVPVHHCMGNHDIWGWNKKKAECTGDEPLWGKKRFCDVLGMERQYYSFSKGGWKIAVLDTIQTDGGSGYVGGIDDPQFEWLKGELTGLRADEHVLVLSHIPIINISTLLSDGDTTKDGWDVSPGLMCLDARRTVNLFAACPNVKAAISGHIHTQEDVTFQGVRYLNNGAVCGNWWKNQAKTKAERAAAGMNVKNWGSLRSEPGYALLDLYADGRVGCEYVAYGWEGEA